MAWLIALVGLLLAYLVSVLVFLDWTPKVRIRILPRWVDLDKGELILRLEIENTSRVPIIKRCCKLQVLEHSVNAQPRLSEFVPFTIEWYDKCLPDQKPNHWREPECIFKTTLFLYPGEVIAVERLEKLPDKDTYLHVGMQFKAHIPFFSRTALRFWGIARIKRDIGHEQWTTTTVIYPTSDKG